MKVTDQYLEILHKYWGYPDFRGIQKEIIESIANGEDTLGLMPTGGGKSITFQVPALAMKGVCIVVTPLIALMKDQVQHLRERGILAEAIYTGLSRSEIIQILENCIFGETKFLYVSPERLASEIFQVSYATSTLASSPSTKPIASANGAMISVHLISASLISER